MIILTNCIWKQEVKEFSNWYQDRKFQWLRKCGTGTSWIAEDRKQSQTETLIHMVSFMTEGTEQPSQYREPHHVMDIQINKNGPFPILPPHTNPTSRWTAKEKQWSTSHVPSALSNPICFYSLLLLHGKNPYFHLF